MRPPHRLILEALYELGALPVASVATKRGEEHVSYALWWIDRKVKGVLPIMLRLVGDSPKSRALLFEEVTQHYERGTVLSEHIGTRSPLRRYSYLQVTIQMPEGGDGYIDDRTVMTLPPEDEVWLRIETAWSIERWFNTADWGRSRAQDEVFKTAFELPTDFPEDPLPPLSGEDAAGFEMDLASATPDDPDD